VGTEGGDVDDGLVWRRNESPALVGRDAELKNWSIALRQLQSARPAPSVVLHGLGGEGRTVLLGEFHRMAEERDLMTVIIEASAGSSLQDTLIKESLVFVPRHGQVAYPIPGMADFITRQSRT